MQIDILTLFPEICRAPLSESMMKRAQENGIVDLRIHNLRDWTADKHHIVDLEISIGDYVLTNGAIAAVILVDATVRLLPGVLGHEFSAEDDSFSPERSGLEAPQYTRPAEFRGWKVPGVLLSGNHAEIEKWRKKEALRRTRENRPDLLDD